MFVEMNYKKRGEIEGKKRGKRGAKEGQKWGVSEYRLMTSSHGYFPNLRCPGEFNPLEPRAHAWLTLVLARPHKKHTNATKRGLRKGER